MSLIRSVAGSRPSTRGRSASAASRAGARATPSTVIGTTAQTPDLAGFANGAAIRYYDLNDAYASPALQPVIRATTSAPASPSPRPRRQRRGRHHRDRAGLRDQLPAGRRLDIGPPRLGHRRLQPAGRGTRRRQADEAAARTAGPGRQSCASMTICRRVRRAPRPTPTGRAWPTPKPSAMRSSPLNWLAVASLGRRRFSRAARGSSSSWRHRQTWTSLLRWAGRAVPDPPCGVKTYPAVVYSQTAIAAGIELTKEIGSGDRITSLEIATTRAWL